MLLNGIKRHPLLRYRNTFRNEPLFIRLKINIITLNYQVWKSRWFCVLTSWRLVVIPTRSLKMAGVSAVIVITLPILLSVASCQTGAKYAKLLQSFLKVRWIVCSKCNSNCFQCHLLTSVARRLKHQQQNPMALSSSKLTCSPMSGTAEWQ